jgi:hypothetical protein
MRLPRIAVFALVAVLAVGLIGGGFAAATTFKTTVTIHFTPNPYYGDKFNGKVKSKKKFCKKHRKVIVFRKKPGPDAKFGSDFTNKKGNYVVAPGKTAKSGNYYAVAKKKKKGKTVCKKGVSKTIFVP